MTIEDEARRGRVGWMVLGQLLLAVAALFSLPLGARDGGGVSSILPPLRSTVAGTDATSDAAERRRVANGCTTTVGIRCIVRRRLVRRARPRPGPARPPCPDRHHESPTSGSRQSRAPPLES